jgi:ABC-type dipeptide/oligopeptide/nickel transport system ATPase subunit
LKGHKRINLIIGTEGENRRGCLVHAMHNYQTLLMFDDIGSILDIKFLAKVLVKHLLQKELRAIMKAVTFSLQIKHMPNLIKATKTC